MYRKNKKVLTMKKKSVILLNVMSKQSTPLSPDALHKMQNDSVMVNIRVLEYAVVFCGGMLCADVYRIFLFLSGGA